MKMSNGYIVFDVVNALGYTFFKKCDLHVHMSSVAKIFLSHDISRIPPGRMGKAYSVEERCLYVHVYMYM